MTPDQISEWWDDEHGWRWNDQLWNYGYAVLPDADDIPFPDCRVAMLAEQRWSNRPTVAPGVPSALWDGNVCHGFRFVNRKARAQVRSAMPEMLAQWKRRRRQAERRARAEALAND